MFELLIIITCLVFLRSQRRYLYWPAVIVLLYVGLILAAAVVAAAMAGVYWAGITLWFASWSWVASSPNAMAVLILLSPVIMLGIGLYMIYRPNVSRLFGKTS